MEQIARSLQAMVLVVAASCCYALSTGLTLAAFATLTLTSTGSSTDLVQAAGWLTFVAALLALAATCGAGWGQLLGGSKADAVELGVAAVATLLITIGTLVGATSNGSSSATDVIEAVGVGVWAALLLIRAGRISLTEQAIGAGPRQATLWLAAAGGLFMFAIGSGFTTDITDKGTGIAAGLLQAAGIAALCGAVAVARASGFFPAGPARLTISGLAIVAAGYLAAAVVAAVVFGIGDFTLTRVRVGMSVIAAIQFLGIAVLGWAAWERVRGLAPQAPSSATVTRSVLDAARGSGPVAVAADASGDAVSGATARRLGCPM
jgi:hypothetical protein